MRAAALVGLALCAGWVTPARAGPVDSLPLEAAPRLGGPEASSPVASLGTWVPVQAVRQSLLAQATRPPAADSLAMHLAGTETVTGSKTFTAPITTFVVINATSGVFSNTVTSSVASGSVAVVLQSGAYLQLDPGGAGNLRYNSALGIELGSHAVPTTTDLYAVGAATRRWTKLYMSKQLDMDATDSSGTPGAATINKPSGQVSIASGASSVVVTNSLVSSTSIVIPVMQAANAGCTEILSCVPGSGTFTITANANCTVSAAKVGFVVVN